eukprot:jgi/Botrbrau1/15724/Bobra.4_1s0093.1
MGRFFIRELLSDGYFCSICTCHLASREDVKSKAFHSRNGPAYLFQAVTNVALGTRENRVMTTGLHEVSDVHCTRCNQLCGWKYEVAHEPDQKYKEGMYVLERDKIQSSDERRYGHGTPPLPRQYFLSRFPPVETATSSEC